VRGAGGTVEERCRFGVEAHAEDALCHTKCHTLSNDEPQARADFIQLDLSSRDLWPERTIP
jgi:hypothetical protein